MGKSKIKLSVIITTYNEELYIGRCLRSIISQSLASDLYEVIVVDDASTDKTPYALELFGESIKVLKNPANLGLPASINRGVESAHGHYIIRLDGDDYVNFNYLNFLLMFLELNENFDAVACDYFIVDDNENVLKRCSAIKQPIGCGIIFNRAQILDLGLYDDSFLRNEERDLRLRFDSKYTMGNLALPLYRYRKHEKNITNDTLIMSEYDLKLRSKHQID